MALKKWLLLFCLWGTGAYAQSGPAGGVVGLGAVNTWLGTQTFNGGNLATGTPSATVGGCLAVQVTRCGQNATFGSLYVPIDVAGIVTVDTQQGGIQINHDFGFLALYQGTGQTFNYPAWSLTLNNDTTLALYYSQYAFMTAKFNAYIVGTTMHVTSVVTPYLIATMTLTNGGVAGGTTIVNQINGTPGGIGDYTVSISQNLGSLNSPVFIDGGPPTPIAMPQQWSPNYTWFRTNCNGVLPDSISTVNYAGGTALCWNQGNVGATTFYNDPGTPGTGTFGYIFNDYNHSTHTTTQLMNIASASNSHPGAMLIGGGGAYPNNGSIGQLNVNAGSNNNIEVMGSTVSNTNLDFYYNGPVFFWQILDPSNNNGNTVAIDMRGNNTNKNSFAAVIGQMVSSTSSTNVGRFALQVANAASYANQQAFIVNPTYVQFGSNATTFVGQVPEHIASAQLTKPTVTSCGTGAADATSTDTAGTVAATGATACTVVFNAAYTSPPRCTVTDNTNAAALKVAYGGTNNAANFTVTGLTSGDTFTYICIGQAGG